MLRPHRLFDFLIAEYGLKNDRALADGLGVKYPMISKMRAGQPVTPRMILLIYKATGMSIEDIESFLQKPKKGAKC